MSPDALATHKSWNNVDYALYDHFNKSLWQRIEKIGPDFYEELTLYRSYLNDAFKYCEPIIKELRRNRTNIFWLQDSLKPLRFEKSKYGDAFEIDTAWCALSRINIAEFYNIMRPVTFPQLCDYLHKDSSNIKEVPPNYFSVNTLKHWVKLFVGYCAKNTRQTLVALETIAPALYI